MWGQGLIILSTANDLKRREVRIAVARQMKVAKSMYPPTVVSSGHDEKNRSARRYQVRMVVSRVDPEKFYWLQKYSRKGKTKQYHQYM